MKRLKRTSFSIFLALWALGSGTGEAALITYHFSVTATTGPLAGTTETGTFSYDSSIIPSGGGSVDATGLLADLLFTWNGIVYDETTANTGSLQFDSVGNLFLAFFGTRCLPGQCGLVVGTNDPNTNDWSVSASVGAGVFDYAFPGTRDTFGGTSTLTGQVAESESLALLATSLAGLGVLGWRCFLPRHDSPHSETSQ